MLKSILHLIIFLFVIAPVCTLIHEFGHALIPLCFGIKVFINVGEGPNINQVIGNLSINIGLLKPWIGYTDWGVGNNSEIASTILGPIFSFILSGIFLFIGFSKYKKFYSALLFASAGWCLFQFIFTLFPFSYPDFLGHKPSMISDGARILELMRI